MISHVGKNFPCVELPKTDPEAYSNVAITYEKDPATACGASATVEFKVGRIILHICI